MATESQMTDRPQQCRHGAGAEFGDQAEQLVGLRPQP
jgi:hypothetical protein